MLSEKVESLAAYVQMIEAVPLLHGFSIFRGQAKKQSLLPGVARKDPTADTTALERDMLRQFSLMGAALLPENATSLDLLVQAQHFGLRTRLLDWTSNPLVALWFACSSQEEGDAYVYALATEGMLLEDAYAIDPFATTSTKVFQPRLNNPRVLAQHGWFTLHCFSPENHRWVRLETHAIAKQGLLEISIPGTHRKAFIESLDRHGVSARTLYPDLGGLCQHLNWQHAAS